jgi:Zn-dependent protease
VLFFAGLLAHELSHALVARARGLPVRQITLFLLGGMAHMEKETPDAKTEFWMGVAGPITSAVIGGALLLLALAGGWAPNVAPQTPWLAVLVWLGYINLALAAFNMIPGYPLDGGRVLRAIVWGITGDGRKATRIASWGGQLIAMLFIVYGIVHFFSGDGFGGLWMAFIGWFLLQAATASQFQLKAESLLSGLRVSDLMTRDCAMVDGQTTLQQFVDEQLLKTARRCFIVTDGGKVAGLITPQEVRQIEREKWMETTVHEAMQPLDRVHFVQPSMPAFAAMEKMSAADVNQLPVMANGHLEGIVSRSQLLQVLQSRAELLR